MFQRKTLKLKGKFSHFMQKEIFHQPVSIEDTILNFADKNSNSIFLPKNEIDFNKISNISFGSLWNGLSCMLGGKVLDRRNYKFTCNYRYWVRVSLQKKILLIKIH